MKVEKLKRFSLKLLCCEARAFPVCTAKTRMRMNLDTWLAAILQRFFVSLIIAYWPFSPLAVSMPPIIDYITLREGYIIYAPTKVCPQCKAAVPVRRKTCERCDLIF